VGPSRLPHDPDATSITRKCNAFGAKKGFECHSAAGATATAAPPQSRMRPIGDVGGGFQFAVTWLGWPIKIVSIVHERTRESLAGMVERSTTVEHLSGERSRLATERATFPAVLRCDNGLELACRATAMSSVSPWTSSRARRAH
jgi:hypothetical protein